MTWIAYTVGALAPPQARRWRRSPTCSAISVLFLLEAATVFLNDWFDFDSDRLNRLGGPFTGGSRVLVDGRLEHAAMRKGIGLSILGAAGALVALAAVVPAASTSTTLAIYALFAMLALAYTVPPLKLSHRGLGEVDVALTHSAGAIMAAT